MGYGKWLGQRARDAHTAATLVTVSAVGFTALWVSLYSPDSSYLPGWLFLVLVPPNAYLVTRGVWARYVTPSESISYRRAVGVGVGTGLLSYLTLSALVGLYLALYDLLVDIPNALLRPPGPLEWLSTSLFFGPLFGLLTTAGIPVLLTTGIALALAHLDRRDRTAEPT